MSEEIKVNLAKLRVEFDSDLHKRLKLVSVKLNISMSALIRNIISSFVLERNLYNNSEYCKQCSTDTYILERIASEIKGCPKPMSSLRFILDRERLNKLKSISENKNVSISEILRNLIVDFLIEKANSQTNDSSSGSDDSSL